jgi:arylsulfatase A-like enzyme
MRTHMARTLSTHRLAIAVAGTGVAAVALAIALASGSDQGAQASTSAPQRPNVVVVMTDDQTVEQMGALTRVRRQIGERGTTFTRNFAAYPLCCPSRATYLTGQYPHNHGVRSNQPPSGGYEKLRRTEANTLPAWMSQAGYATAHIGKYLNGYGRTDPRHVPAGWQEWYGSLDPSTYNFSRYCLNENGALAAYGRPGMALPPPCRGAVERGPKYQADRYTDEAVGYIRRRAPSTQPFMLSIAYLAPHSGGPRRPGSRCQGSARPAPRHRGRFATAPLPRPPSFNEADVSDKPAHIRALPRFGAPKIQKIATDYRCRRESLLAVDEGVGRIMQALRQAGELENTLVIFTADNGFFQGEHRVPKGKIKAYEPSARVPALMRGPGVPAGRRVSAPTANVDLAATIADVGGATPGRALDGVSLRDVATRPHAYARRAIVLENGPDGGARNPEYVALRTGRYKLVVYANGERELYDLRRDPDELRNIAGRSPQTAALAQRLERLRHCASAGCSE